MKYFKNQNNVMLDSDNVIRTFSLNYTDFLFLRNPASVILVTGVVPG